MPSKVPARVVYAPPPTGTCSTIRRIFGWLFIILGTLAIIAAIIWVIVQLVWQHQLVHTTCVVTSRWIEQRTYDDRSHDCVSCDVPGYHGTCGKTRNFVCHVRVLYKDNDDKNRVEEAVNMGQECWTSSGEGCNRHDCHGIPKPDAERDFVSDQPGWCDGFCPGSETECWYNRDSNDLVTVRWPFYSLWWTALLGGLGILGLIFGLCMRPWRRDYSHRNKHWLVGHIESPPLEPLHRAQPPSPSPGPPPAPRAPRPYGPTSTSTAMANINQTPIMIGSPGWGLMSPPQPAPPPPPPPMQLPPINIHMPVNISGATASSHTTAPQHHGNALQYSDARGATSQNQMYDEPTIVPASGGMPRLMTAQQSTPYYTAPAMRPITLNAPPEPVFRTSTVGGLPPAYNSTVVEELPSNNAGRATSPATSSAAGTAQSTGVYPPPPTAPYQ